MLVGITIYSEITHVLEVPVETIDSKGRKTVGITLPQALIARLDRDAAAEYLPLSRHIERLIRRALSSCHDTPAEAKEQTSD